MDGSELNQKALRLQALLETRIVREHGLIPMFVRASDYMLPTAEDYKGAYHHRYLRGKTEADLGLPPMHVWRHVRHAVQAYSSNQCISLCKVARVQRGSNSV